MLHIRSVQVGDAIRSLRNPHKAKRYSVPKVPYDAPMKDIEQSIRLTLAYLSACNPPFVGGKVKQLRSGQLTALWPLDIKSSYSTDKISRVAIRTDKHFFFDARGHLYVEVREYENLIIARKTALKSTHTIECSEREQAELMLKLEQIRSELVKKKIPHHVKS